MTGPAERLRAAAARLRDVAGDVPAGAWEVPGWDHNAVLYTAGEHPGGMVAVSPDYHAPSIATHIALMDPPAALAVAGWLEEERAWVEREADHYRPAHTTAGGACLACRHTDAALAVADAVLGGQP